MAKQLFEGDGSVFVQELIFAAEFRFGQPAEKQLSAKPHLESWTRAAFDKGGNPSAHQK